MLKKLSLQVFMAPEVFFHPEFANDNFTEPLSSVVDKTIQVIMIEVEKEYPHVKPIFLLLC